MFSPGDVCKRSILGTDGEFYRETVEYVAYRETWENLRIAVVRAESGREFGCFEYHLVRE